MCGRANVSDHKGVQQLLDQLGITLNKNTFTPRYNIAPSADLLIAFASAPHDLAQMHWGILPDWARHKPGSRPLINARLETAWEKPSFRKLIHNTRAIVPINGFYEWKRSDRQKTPYYIKQADDAALALAGLYQITQQGTMEVAILTRESVGDMAAIHHRMPVTLSPENMQTWLGSDSDNEIKELLAVQPDPALEIIQVSSYVNHAANDGAACIEPVAA